MNTHDDDREDALLEDYRRASDARADRPGESTRKAILEGARAAARSRHPAANDSRYAWSAAAGIAVLGIALMLWRQADPRLTASTPASAEAVPAQPAFKAESRVAATPAAPAEARREATADSEAASQPAFADAGERTLRDRFPDAWASSSPPAMVWIVEDARGNPLRQGVLAAGEPLPTLQSASLSQLSRSANVGASAADAADAAGHLRSVTTGWTLQTAVNDAGVPVRIATARETQVAPAATTSPAGIDR